MENRETMNDPVNHPRHYTVHPSGVECIQITEHMNFCLGNAMKYIWRAGEKSNAIEDLEKAKWYVDREIARLLSILPYPEQPYDEHENIEIDLCQTGVNPI